MNRPFHTTTFHVWWDHLDAATGKLVRTEKVFKRKEEAALFVRKQPHITQRLDGAGCYMKAETKEVHRDGKTRLTTVKEDVWTYREMVALAGR